jgi:hypothetical protein
MRALAALAALLRPSGDEMVALVRAEMDPLRARSFEQLCFGPLLSALALAGVIAAAAVVTPLRLVWRLIAKRQ